MWSTKHKSIGEGDNVVVFYVFGRKILEGIEFQVTIKSIRLDQLANDTIH